MTSSQRAGGGDMGWLGGATAAKVAAIVWSAGRGRICVSDDVGVGWMVVYVCTCLHILLVCEHLSVTQADSGSDSPSVCLG